MYMCVHYNVYILIGYYVYLFNIYIYIYIYIYAIYYIHTQFITYINIRYTYI